MASTTTFIRACSFIDVISLPVNDRSTEAAKNPLKGAPIRLAIIEKQKNTIANEIITKIGQISHVKYSSQSQRAKSPLIKLLSESAPKRMAVANNKVFMSKGITT